MEPSSRIPFDQLIEQLLDGDHPLVANYFYSLSDLEPEETQSLSKIWGNIPLWRRQAIMEDVEALSADDVLLSFVNFSLMVLQDSNAGIRQQGVQSLWEYEDDALIPVYQHLILKDEDPGVRAAAAGALGRYIYNGELDELAPEVLHDIEELLLAVAQGEDAPNVRRAALEALGFSSCKELSPLIERAYASKEKEWIASALFAMGRSGNEKWRQHVAAMLEHPTPLVRMEAARAAGELEMKETTQTLIELLDDPNDNTRMACIWSLSQLGGEGVRQILEDIVEEADAEDNLEFLEAALDNLEFTESMELMPLLDISEDGEEDELDLIEDFYDLDEDLDD
ncbi:MAG TPA: HEAT repeat domain-containing protein [Anaerolineales bacterium]|nr:HEAT repeat domain-containing protein [Anaerolineales bacterium]